jgi:hypothetical protein
MSSDSKHEAVSEHRSTSAHPPSPRFRVTIAEWVESSIVIEASSPKNAEEKAQALYSKEIYSGGIRSFEFETGLDEVRVTEISPGDAG